MRLTRDAFGFSAREQPATAGASRDKRCEFSVAPIRAKALARIDRALEERLTDVMLFLLRNTIRVAVRDRHAEAARRAKAEAEQRQFQEEQRRWELEDQRSKEQARIIALIEEAAKWRPAEDIRAYIAATQNGADSYLGACGSRLNRSARPLNRATGAAKALAVANTQDAD
jgi:hypothetical protein